MVKGWVAVLAVVAVSFVGLALLGFRRRPTVWSSTLVRLVLAGLAGLALVLGAPALVSLLLAAGLIALIGLISFRSRDFLLMFARSDALRTVEQSLLKVGVQYERDARTFHVRRPNIGLRFVPLGPGMFWVSLSTARWTPKGDLIGQTLRKFLSN